MDAAAGAVEECGGVLHLSPVATCVFVARRRSTTRISVAHTLGRNRRRASARCGHDSGRKFGEPRPLKCALRQSRESIAASDV
jgi:hypothetical protein